MNFAIHVRNLIKGLRFKSFLLYKVKDYMTERVLLKVYKAHMLPVIDYADVLYASSNVDILEELQRVQNKSLKICLKKHILTPTVFGPCRGKPTHVRGT